MPRPQQESFQAVVVTVCLEPRGAQAVVAAVERLPWLTDISHLDSYSSATRRPAFGPQMRAADAGFAFIDYTQNVDQAISCTQYLVENFGSKLTVIAVGLGQRPDLILEAMRAGCSEYVASPVTEHALAEVIQRIGQRWSYNARNTREEGSLIALVGAKGGVGTTTLAVHLAYYLAQHQKRVLLIDAQPELGHACIFLGLDGASFTFAEVVRNVSRLDSDLLQSFVVKHSSGLSVLSSPETASRQRTFDAASVAKALAFVRSEFDYVIVDCDRVFTEVTRTVVDTASRIFLVTTPEISAVRDLSRYIDRIQQNCEAADLLRVVLNRHTAQSGIDVAKIEKAIRLSIHIRIPNNYPALIKAGNLGQPLSVDSRVDVAQELRKWAASLVQISQPEAKVSEGRERSWSLWGRRPEAQRKGATA